MPYYLLLLIGFQVTIFNYLLGLFVISIQMQLCTMYIILCIFISIIILNITRQKTRLEMQKKKKVEHLSSVVDPHKVKVLILTDQRTVYQDFYFIMKFVNIVKLDLSYNKIVAFNVGFSFAGFPNLRTLFLHYNRFNSLKSLQVVSESPALQYLTLFGNSLEETKTRHYFVNSIPSLKLMDDKIITMQQRNPVIVSPQIQKIIKMQFPIVNVQLAEGSSSFLAVVVQELRIIRQKYMQANPVISIQRQFRKRLKKLNTDSSNRFKTSNIVDSQQSVINKLQAAEIYQQGKKLGTADKKRLTTQKMQIHVSREQKIFSVLVMNMQFLAFLKQKSRKKVFAIKQFCDQQGIKYQDTTKKLVCLRTPTIDEESQGKSHLQLLIKSCQKYLLRRKGSEQSMNLRKKYKILQTIINKRRKRQPKYFSKLQQYKPNMQLWKKIQKLQKSYQNKFVHITEQPQKIYELLRSNFFACLSNKRLFPFCLQEIVERSAAALSIQRMWKGYITRKKIINSIQSITKDNCAWLIQRFIRNLGFRKRNTMFIQLIDYVKKQGNTSQIIMRMSDVLRLERIYMEVLTGINFVLPDQKIVFHINQQTNQAYVQKNQYIKLPSYLRNYIPSIQKSYFDQQCQNILDILFKGAKSVKYFSSNNVLLETKNTQKALKAISNNNTKPKNTQKTLTINQSTSQLENNGVIIIKSKQTYSKAQKQSQQAKNSDRNYSNFVILQYNNSTQATNRKFLLALLSYKIKSNTFIKSMMLNINQSSTNAIKDINQRVNQQFIIYKLTEENNPSMPAVYKLADRQQSNLMKIKLFVSQDQLTIKTRCKYPYQKTKTKAQLPANQQSVLNTSINGSKKGPSYREFRHSANITKNILKFQPEVFPNDTQSSANNFVSYRQIQQKFNKNIRSRYQDLQQVDLNNKSLQKCQSLQPNSARKQVVNHFFTTNENLQKSYATQIQDLSVTENLRGNLSNYKRSLGYQSLNEQKQTRKKIITLMKQSHRQRLQSNHQYKKDELNRLREKLNDQMEENNRIIQSNRLDGILANARKHNRVIKALSKKASEVKNFQKDFLKKGNTSIRKQMIRFQQDRSSSKSPDNESISIYQSKKSLQVLHQQTKFKLIKKSQKMINLKTQIKQFSVDGNSDVDGDLSLGAFQAENRSKQRHRRNCQKQKQQQERRRQLQIQKRQQKQHSARLANDSRKKQLKKRKVVHSVFPQQFYPLKQVKKIGFQLPKINKK